MVTGTGEEGSSRAADTEQRGDARLSAGRGALRLRCEQGEGAAAAPGGEPAGKRRGDLVARPPDVRRPGAPRAERQRGRQAEQRQR